MPRQNRFDLRREVAAVAVLLTLATPTGVHALVAVSNWTGAYLARTVTNSIHQPHASTRAVTSDKAAGKAR